MGLIPFPSDGLWQEHSQGGRCRVGRLSALKTHTLWCALANVLEPKQTVRPLHHGSATSSPSQWKCIIQLENRCLRLIFKGQLVVRFLNPPIKHQLGEAAPLVKANVDIVAWYAVLSCRLSKPVLEQRKEFITDCYKCSSAGARWVRLLDPQQREHSDRWLWWES